MDFKITRIVAPISSNTYVIEKDKKAVLIDCAVSADEIFAATGDSGLKIEAVFLTHTHFDHICFVNEICHQFNCPVYLIENCAHKLKSAKENLSVLFNQNFIVNNDVKIVELKHLQEISILNNLKLKVFWAPGHSKCSTCYLLNDILFSGDTIFKSCIGRCDLNDSSFEEMKNSLKLISGINFTIGYPGHNKEYDFENAQKTISRNLEN